MPERAKSRAFLAAWIAVSLTLCGSALRGSWYLSKMSNSVDNYGDDLRAIRGDIKDFKTEYKRDIDALKDRTARIEERQHVTGDFYDRTKQ